MFLRGVAGNHNLLRVFFASFTLRTCRILNYDSPLEAFEGDLSSFFPEFMAM
ncbi:MAG: hypothetical protein H6577_28240 [Lewinellaceae bacterium]|nr:hypothetical protein [Saprospiraceae bacterium]MCB9342037.1 hypothetical protein [Lewinellaceae bacterium]